MNQSDRHSDQRKLNKLEPRPEQNKIKHGLYLELCGSGKNHHGIDS